MTAQHSGDYAGTAERGPIEVKGPVFATVGPVYLRLFPYDSVQTAVDDYDARPWAWGALCRITFRIGELTTSKRVTQRVTYLDSRGWARHNRPEEAELAIGRQQVLDNLRTQIARHGFEPPKFEVIEEPEPGEPNDSEVTA